MNPKSLSFLDNVRGDEALWLHFQQKGRNSLAIILAMSGVLSLRSFELGYTFLLDVR